MTPPRRYQAEKPTQTQIKFAAQEGMPVTPDASLLPPGYGTGLHKLDPGIRRGTLTLRREGDHYAGELVLHGFHYVIAARVVEDAAGKHFAGVIHDDMSQQFAEIECADLPITARDPRLSATAVEMLAASGEVFGEG